MPSLRSVLRRRDSPRVVTSVAAGALPPHPQRPIDVDGGSISLGGTGFGVTTLSRSSRRRAGRARLQIGPLSWSAGGERASSERRKPRRSGAFSQAAEGTRTLDLLHGKRFMASSKPGLYLQMWGFYSPGRSPIFGNREIFEGVSVLIPCSLRARAPVTLATDTGLPGRLRCQVMSLVGRSLG